MSAAKRTALRHVLGLCLSAVPVCSQNTSIPEALSCTEESTLRPKPNGVDGFINFENGTDRDIRVYKLDQTGHRHIYQNLHPQYAYQQYTQPGEIWLIVDPAGKCLRILRATSSASLIRFGDRLIISRRGIPPFTMRTSIATGYSLRPDEKGPYRHGQDFMSSTMCEALNLWLDIANPNKSPIPACGAPQRHAEPGNDRSVGFDLTHPVPESGAQNRGIIKANTAAANVFWEHDPERHTTYSIQALPLGQTSSSERVNLSVTIDGKRHMLQFGSGAPGEFTSTLQNVHGNGTTAARITRDSETEWTIDAREGSIGRLWDISDGKIALDKGLYRFSFKIRFELLPDMLH